MSVFRNDKVMLTKEYENMNVGKIYEVANITDTVVVLRDADNKVAVGAIDIDSFSQYFQKQEDVKKWTKWCGLRDIKEDDCIAYYRTNGKKVQVRNIDGTQAEASCNKNDEFNLSFGINIAWARCKIKMMKDLKEDYEKSLKQINSNIIDTQHLIKRMINSLEDNNKDNKDIKNN